MLKPGNKVPALTLPLTNNTQYDLAKQDSDNFKLVIFYRGKHCPICKMYLEELAGKLDEFTKRGISVVAVSMDSKDRAMVVHNEWETGDVPIAYDMAEDVAREWGLFLSEKIPDSSEPDVFAEPGLFITRPDGELYFSSVQNAPFTRPSLEQLLQGLDFVMKAGYPTRGTRA